MRDTVRVMVIVRDSHLSEDKHLSCLCPDEQQDAVRVNISRRDMVSIRIRLRV